MKFFFVSFLFLILSGILSPSAFAQTLYFNTGTSYPAGETFPVTVFVDTQNKLINTVSGKIKIDPTKLTITNVSYGNSIINLWVEKPTINAVAGTISFVGGTPGGYSGNNGQILVLSLRGNAQGLTSITANDVKILLNDGMGTEISSTAKPATITIGKALEKAAPKATTPVTEGVVENRAGDTRPPDDFVPIVSRHPSVAHNKYFISFSTVDTDSGISHYEIAEEKRWVPATGPLVWTPAATPHILKNQLWGTLIYVKAYDKEGNMREAYAVKSFDNSLVFLMALLGAIIAMFIFRRVVFRKDKPHRTKKV